MNYENLRIDAVAAINKNSPFRMRETTAQDVLRLLKDRDMLLDAIKDGLLLIEKECADGEHTGEAKVMRAAIRFSEQTS